MYDQYNMFELASSVCSVIQWFIRMDVTIASPMKLQGFSFVRDSKRWKIDSNMFQYPLFFGNGNEFKHFISDLSDSLGGGGEMTNRASSLFSFCF